MPARRTKLTPPTEADARERPDQIRRTPNGGLAWKCAYCNLYASSRSSKGLYICYRHGGERALQRDPVKRQRVRDAGGEPPKPAGRPMTHGFYSSSEPVPVRELVEAYRRASENPDDTDADMLHLRARVENLLALEPLVTDAATELEAAFEELKAWRAAKVLDGGERSVARVLADLDRLDELTALVGELKRTLALYLGFQAQIEQRHHDLIKAAKTRAETRFKDRAAREAQVFTVLLERLTLALSEQMPPEAYRALMVRLEHDLDTVPARRLGAPAGS